jgi:hypothetical protein
MANKESILMGTTGGRDDLPQLKDKQPKSAGRFSWP